MLMGWAIPERTKRQLKKMQEAFLNQLFDNGAKSGNKITEQRMRKQFDPKDYLPVTIVLFFKNSC